MHPPVGDLVAAYLGYKAPADAVVGAASRRPEPPRGGQYGTLDELVADFRSVGGQVK